MKDEYIFPAIFDFSDENNISIEFPDLPGCYSCANNVNEATKNASEALELHLWSMEADKDNIPPPTPITKLKLELNCIPILIKVWMPLVRSEIDNKAIKKTLTIPKWLNIIAEKNKVNFSQILQAALKNYLNIKK